jgi:hypothetical protein
MKTKMIEQVQEQEQISEELVTKFDGDKQLVQEFLDQGYTVSELQNSTITRPTKYDPMVTLEDGRTAGFWIDKPLEGKYQDNSRLYQDRHNRFF